MKKYSDDLDLNFKDYSQLSYKELGKRHIEFYLDNKIVGLVEVWTDRENENREYVLVNYEMVYLDTIKKVK